MDRKEIVRALENHFQVKAKYMKAPSFAYEIEAGGRVFTIGRDGEINDANSKEYELDELLNSKEEAEIKSECGFEVVVDFDGHTGKSLRNLLNMLYSKQNFIKKALGIEDDFINKEVIEELAGVDINDVEDFQKVISETDDDKYSGIEFDFENKKITFKFYEGEISPERTTVYTQFVSLVNIRAKEIKRASSKITISDNPRYTFRTWLLRLGMIGDEYKVARKILLANLEGNIAFSNQGNSK